MGTLINLYLNRYLVETYLIGVIYRDYFIR